MRWLYLLLSLHLLAQASPVYPRQNSSLTATAPTTSSSEYVCDYGCSGSACTAKVRRDYITQALSLAERHLEDAKDLDTTNEYYIYDRILSDKNAQNLNWAYQSVDSVSIDGEWTPIPDEQRAYVAGLTGCTGIAIVSEKGYWMAHFMEPPIMGGGQVYEDRWADKVLKVLQDPTAQFGNRFKQPALLAIPGGILAPDTNPQVFVMSPKDAAGDWRYDTRVKKIIDLLGFPNVKLNKKAYIKDESRFAEFEKKSYGKMMVEYSPEQLDENYERRKPNQAIWRVYMEDSMTEHVWDYPSSSSSSSSASSTSSSSASKTSGSTSASATSGSSASKASGSSSVSKTSGTSSVTSTSGSTSASRISSYSSASKTSSPTSVSVTSGSSSVSHASSGSGASGTSSASRDSGISSVSMTSGSTSATSHVSTTGSVTASSTKSKEPSKASSASQASSTAKKGNCPAGKVLDPAEGGQDENTKNPKCIGDDDSKCPAGQKAATRRPELADRDDWDPECAPDDGKDHKCKDANTYDHREIVDGKIQHSCRSTRKSQKNNEDSYTKKSKDASSDKSNRDKATEEERKKKAKRTRTGWCFVALSAVEAPDFTNDIVNAMSQDEIDGMTGLWADDSIPSPIGEGDIPDQKIKFTEKAYVTGIESADAGIGGIFSALGKIFGKVGDDAAGAAKAGSSTAKTLRSGSKAAPAAKAIDAAKASSTVSKMLKSQRFRDCLAATAGAAASAVEDAISQKAAAFDGTWGTYEVDWSLGEDPKIHPVPDDDPNRNIIVKYGDKTDSVKDGYGYSYQTHHDGYHRLGRVYYEDCNGIDGNLDNKITDLEVWNGCCTFYNGGNCEKDTIMFSMTNREDGQLKGEDNDAVSSYWCTFDAGCKGAPGM